MKKVVLSTKETSIILHACLENALTMQRPNSIDSCTHCVSESDSLLYLAIYIIAVEILVMPCMFVVKLMLHACMYIVYLSFASYKLSTYFTARSEK